jgi:hypothetical protein
LSVARPPWFPVARTKYPGQLVARSRANLARNLPDALAVSTFRLVVPSTVATTVTCSRAPNPVPRTVSGTASTSCNLAVVRALP